MGKINCYSIKMALAILSSKQYSKINFLHIADRKLYTKNNCLVLETDLCKNKQI